MGCITLYYGYWAVHALEKSPVTKKLLLEGKSRMKESIISMTLPSSMRKEPDNSCGINLPRIKILKYRYHRTPEMKPSQLPKRFQVSPIHLSPTPEMGAWFNNDDNQTHCI